MRRAIYAGSFNPITNGHMSVIRKATQVCDGLIIGVGHNPNKPVDFFSVEERLEAIEASLEPLRAQTDCRIEVKAYCGLLVDFANQENVNLLVRGLRPLGDFDYEYNMAMTNRALRVREPRLETFFLLADPATAHMSSSIVREVLNFGGDITGMVPVAVKAKIEAKARMKDRTL